jgi:DNA-binding response OmpR family regulator
VAGEKVLVVDDSEPVRVLLESTLRGAGYAVRCADSGETALGHCREWLPDLVLLDVLMPGMDGHMTAIEIKYDERLKDTPLLFLSADLSEESRSQGLGLGAEAYVTKPFEPGALIAKVGSILRPLGEAGGPDKDLAGS